MTQPTAAETGASASAGDRPAPKLALPANAATSIAPDILATLPDEYRTDGETTAPTEAESAPDPELEADDAADSQPGPEDAEPGTDDEPDEADAQQQLAQWVGALDTNPRSITAVPRARQAEVISAWKQWTEQAAEAAVKEAYETGRKQALQQSSIEAEVKTLDALFEDGDIQAFRERVAKFPGGEKNYHRVKAEMAPVPENSPEALNQRAARIFAPLQQQYPDAAKEFTARWNYRATDEDLERLAIDVGAALARAEAAKGRNDPDRQKLEQREQNVERLRKAPKPETAAAGSSTGPLTPERIAKMTPQEIADHMRKHPGEIDRVMAAQGSAR